MRWRHTPKQPRPPDDVIGDIITRDVALAGTLSTKDRARLRELTGELIVHKRWEPIGDVTITDDILVTIAANASIPILALGVGTYRAVHSILVHPTARRTSSVRAGPAAGVRMSDPISTVGEVAPNSGPLSISWDTALAQSRSPAGGQNVIIHEFAHKIDMLDGYSDGTPPLHGAELTAWSALLRDHYERAHPGPSDAALRPYAWTNPAEFFAVSTEVFFCTPVKLRDAKPDLYQALVDFYKLDPANR